MKSTSPSGDAEPKKPRGAERRESSRRARGGSSRRSTATARIRTVGAYDAAGRIARVLGRLPFERHPEREDAAVRRDQPVAAAVGRARHRHHRAPRASCRRSIRGSARRRTRRRRRRPRRTNSRVPLAVMARSSTRAFSRMPAGRSVEARVAEGEDAAVGARAGCSRDRSASPPCRRSARSTASRFTPP